MNFISTKELSERWQISASRIVRLAKAGRIPGAKLAGKSWVFPADVEKPSDSRRTENKGETRQAVFRFPLYSYSPYSDEEIRDSFTADERALYNSERLFFKGEYKECHKQLSALYGSTADRYVRFGALYYLCLSCVYLHRYGSAFYYYNEVQSLYLNETAHKTELGFLIRDLESYFVGNSYYIEGFDIDMSAQYPLHMREYLLLECAYSDMLRNQYKDVPVSPQPYEMILQTDRDRFSPLSLLTMHLYVAVICRACGRNERSVYHIREACRIAEEQELEHSSIAYMSKYLLNVYKSALLSSDPEQLSRLRAISDDMFKAFRGLFDFAGKNSLLHILEPADSTLISYAIREMTNKEVAAALRLSENTISKRYSVLFEKTGTHSKKELAGWYLRTIKDY